MMVELKNSHLRAESERHVMLEYKGQRINGTLKLDLLVEECIVVE
jgi:GxxExxY protein